MRVFVTSLFFIFYFSSHCALAAGDEKIIEAVLSEYGKPWQQTSGMKQYGHTFSVRQQAKGPLTRLWAYPQKMNMQIDYENGRGEHRILNGELAWQHGQIAKPMLHKAIVLLAARLALPVTLREHADDAKLRGKTEQGLQRIALSLGDELQLLLFVDSRNYIVKSEGVLAMGGGSMSFSTEYSDFRMVEGRLLAFRETHYAMGRQTGYSQLHEVSFPASLKDDKFQPR